MHLKQHLSIDQEQTKMIILVGTCVYATSLLRNCSFRATHPSLLPFNGRNATPESSIVSLFKTHQSPLTASACPLCILN